jgi:hypothetical protein
MSVDRSVSADVPDATIRKGPQALEETCGPFFDPPIVLRMKRPLTICPAAIRVKVVRDEIVAPGPGDTTLPRAVFYLESG